MKCIGKYSKLISVLLLTVVMATGCGITDLLGTKNVVAEYEAENYNKDLYTGKLFASDLCVASGDISLSGISSDETNTLHSAALFDVDRKKVDFSYQMFDKIYPASTTKIMTALVALENADLSDVSGKLLFVDYNSELTIDEHAAFAREAGAAALFIFDSSRETTFVDTTREDWTYPVAAYKYDSLTKALEPSHPATIHINPR